MHAQEIFKNDELQEKKQESIVDKLFYKKKREKVDMNFIVYGKLT